jgi:glycosyltransferase involved in cell wall biosynthesis
VRLVFIADGHSPIAKNWIGYFLATGHEVHLISSYPCEGDSRLASLTTVPVAFRGARTSHLRVGVPRQPALLSWIQTAAGQRIRVGLRQWLGPLSLPRAARRIGKALKEIRPELVHAMRIPFEGMVAALANPSPPLLISTWGNDFTFHARSSPVMALATRQAVRRADALHADCHRDVRLAAAWGFAPDRPSIVLPGNGGVRAEVFHPPGASREPVPESLAGVIGGVPEGARWIINPRGFRVYVRHDTFFRMVPQVLAHHPDVHFVCPAMAGERVAERWVGDLGIGGAVHLLPRLTAEALAFLYRRSSAAVSLGIHDGTPNTLLEAMACGCVPVVGHLESIGELVRDEENGLLVDPGDPASVAAAVNRVLEDESLRARAAAENARLIARRARYEDVMSRANEFYTTLAGGSARRGGRSTVRSGEG